MGFEMTNRWQWPREKCPSCGKVHRIHPQGVCGATKRISRSVDNARRKKYKTGVSFKHLTGEP